MSFDPPLRPTALLNFKKTDDDLAVIVGTFWQMIWAKKSPPSTRRPAICYRCPMQSGPGDFVRLRESWLKLMRRVRRLPNLTNSSVSLSGIRERESLHPKSVHRLCSRPINWPKAWKKTELNGRSL